MIADKKISLMLRDLYLKLKSAVEKFLKLRRIIHCTIHVPLKVPLPILFFDKVIHINITWVLVATEKHQVQAH